MYFENLSGIEFEDACAGLLQKNGFEQVKVTKGSGDQGVDIVALRDGVRFAIQCKCYSSPVNNKAIQEVFSGKVFYDCDAAIVMTNSTFTKGAKDLAQKTGVLLWDRTELQRLNRLSELIQQIKQTQDIELNNEPNLDTSRFKEVLGIQIYIPKLFEQVGIVRGGQISRSDFQRLIQRVRELTNTPIDSPNSRIPSQFVSNLISEYELQIIEPKLKPSGCVVAILKFFSVLFGLSFILGIIAAIIR